jgi:hypothetical protein
MLSLQNINEHAHDVASVSEHKFGFVEAIQVGNVLGISWDSIDVEQFTIGMNVELEHGRRNPATDVTHDEPLLTGKIALAHLREIPNYYARLAVMESKAKQDKST